MIYHHFIDRVVEGTVPQSSDILAGRWYKAIMDSLKLFCSKTSLHGWSYLTEHGTSAVLKVLWFGVLILTATGAVVLVTVHVFDFMRLEKFINIRPGELR